jgi:hypothetical protein
VGPLGGPGADDVVALRHQDLDLEPEIGKRRPEPRGNLLLAFGPRCGVGGPEIMTDVIGREDVVADVDVATVPDFLVEPTDERLVLGGGQ